MICKNFKTITHAAFVVFLTISTINAQTMPRSIEINADHSLASNQTLDMKAYESICIREGFKMASGSTMRLMVMPKREEDQAAIDLPPTVYPNPSPGKIAVQGIFNSDEFIIYDHSGNLEMRVTLNGENPVVDISGLKKETYFIRTSKSEKTTRLARN